MQRIKTLGDINKVEDRNLLKFIQAVRDINKDDKVVEALQMAGNKLDSLLEITALPDDRDNTIIFNNFLHAKEWFTPAGQKTDSNNHLHNLLLNTASNFLAYQKSDERYIMVAEAKAKAKAKAKAEAKMEEGIKEFRKAVEEVVADREYSSDTDTLEYVIKYSTHEDFEKIVKNSDGDIIMTAREIQKLYSEKTGQTRAAESPSPHSTGLIAKLLFELFPDEDEKITSALEIKSRFADYQSKIDPITKLSNKELEIEYRTYILSPEGNADVNILAHPIVKEAIRRCEKSFDANRFILTLCNMRDMDRNESRIKQIEGVIDQFKAGTYVNPEKPPPGGYTKSARKM